MIFMRIKKLLSVLVITAIPFQVSATCNYMMKQSTPTSSMVLNGDGTVSDPRTGLMWKRCQEGMSISADKTSCEGAASTYRFDTALQQANTHNISGYAGYKNWRVPNVKDLASILEEACEYPALNENLFPNAGSYWVISSTLAIGDDEENMGVSFSSGKISKLDRGYGSNRIRLVRDINTSPVADAGSSQSVNEGSLVTLDASGSVDTDGVIATYAWVQVSGTTAILNSTSISSPKFTAPVISADETLIFKVTITDDGGKSSYSYITVDLADVNSLPVSNSGLDQSVNERAITALDGSGSYDPDGTITSYSWTQTAGTIVSLSSTTVISPIFTSPGVSSNENLNFNLEVTDNDNATHSDSVTITINNVTAMPVASAGNDKAIYETSDFELDGSLSSDPNGLIVSYSWAQTAGNPITINNSNNVIADFTAPNVAAAEVATFELTITDDDSNIHTDIVLITINDIKKSQILTDTGLTVGGNYPSGHNASCIGETISQQDCSHGYDNTTNDDTDGLAGSQYTKLDGSGSDLPSNAVSWSCVRDDITDLIWEVKLEDGGLRDKNNVYRWGGVGAEAYGDLYYLDWDTLVTEANTNTLCGFSDWRVPFIGELQSLINYNRPDPDVGWDTNYFPDQIIGNANYYWSVSAYSGANNRAKAVRFNTGELDWSGYKSTYRRVRLVRGGI